MKLFSTQEVGSLSKAPFLKKITRSGSRRLGGGVSYSESRDWMNS